MVGNENLRRIIIKIANIIIPNDKIFIKLNYRRKIRRKLNLENPSLYTEKIQWIKLYENNPMLTECTDKVSVREYVKKKIGEEYLINTIGVYDSVEELNWEKLPNQFVIQCSHDSKSTKIIKDKSAISDRDTKRIFKFYKIRLKQNYYHFSREKHYKEIVPKLIVNQFLSDQKQEDSGINDYKIFCFNGQPVYIQVDTCRMTQHKRSIYDINWNKIDTKWCYEYAECEKPLNLKEMLRIAEILSNEFYFVRVDLYSVNGKIYFGELTFTPGSGFERFENDIFDLKFGELIKLPLCKNRRV